MEHDAIQFLKLFSILYPNPKATGRQDTAKGKAGAGTEYGREAAPEGFSLG